MKRNHILYRALLVLLVIGAVLLLLFRAAQDTLKVVTGNSVPAIAATSTPQAFPPRPVAPQPATVINQPEPEANQKAYMAAFLTPIAFFGKIVDETGAPVSGATVKAGANDNPNPMGEGSTYELTTDAEGSFSIKNIRGISLSVQVSKAGYYSTMQSRGKANYVLKNNTDLRVPTPDSPAVFVLRKMGEAADLLRAEKCVYLPKNGSPVMIDLENGMVSSRGDVRIECWVQDHGVDTTVYNPYDWRCVVSVPDGGLMERSDPLDFTAPQEKYQPSDVIQMPRGAEHWRQQASKEYFVKRANGTFGRLQVRVVTGMNNFVRFESFVNPKRGDRNLQYDAEKQIQ